MMNAISPVTLYETTKATSIEAVKFKDGMIVTANDLEAAMRYPVSMFQTLVRSYFGCGVVCGMEFVPDPNAIKGEPSYVFCIKPGVALDCHGFPLALCSPVKIDLTPDPCSPVETQQKVCIAIRRYTSDEAPRDACACDTDDPRFQCTRVRDHVMIKAFLEGELNDLPGSLCAKPEDDDGEEQYCEPVEAEAGTAGNGIAALCECLKACPDCDCCGDAWVLLGCVDLEAGKINFDLRRRKYVKPIECLCAISPEMQAMQETINAVQPEILAMQERTVMLEEQVVQLRGQIKDGLLTKAKAAVTEKETPKPAAKAAQKIAPKTSPKAGSTKRNS